MVRIVTNADDTLIASVKAGEHLFREGDPGREMFIIQDGAVELQKKIGDSDERLLTLTAGDFCGDQGLFPATRMPARRGPFRP